MKKYSYPAMSEWKALLTRPLMPVATISETVGAVLDAVRERGDEALREFEQRFDGVTLTDLEVNESELSESESLVSEELKHSISLAKQTITTFHEVLLVLDGSTGQNAFEQAKQFTLATEVNTLAITKLDGTAKGGVVIGISDQFQIPVKYIGLGEGIDHLQLFNRRRYVNSLFGKDE